ncbi:ABC transporter permease [Streptomyces sp. NBC_01716]|uniref:ABC transporter permease n=1 Tax=Streptomyces sp. NBC_01716 TaxID=2975917 RepID=UPI002E312971|nr:ABC transporter permease [Streptomyces sp. NBC_01716]
MTVPSLYPGQPAESPGPSARVATDKSGRRLVTERFLRHRMAVAGLFILSALMICCYGAAWIAPYPRNAQNLLTGALAPSGQHWLGTDDLGRDYLTELLYAGQVSLTVGLGVAVLSTAVGTLVGAASGLIGGWIDELIMRVTDLFLIIPAIALLALAMQTLSPSPVTIVLVLAGLGWTVIARVVRSQVISLREKEFVEAALVLGASRTQIIGRHLLPNLLGVIIVNASLSVAAAIILESTLSFLGFGIQPPQSSWGNMLNQAAGLVGTPKDYLLYAPGVAILLTVLAVNFLGDGLRDAFDHQSRQ